MKTKKRFPFNPGLLLFAFLVIHGSLASAQHVSDSRSKKETFGVTPESTLEIENKYGTILIVPWDKDSVQITADIYLEAKSYSKLKSLKNDVRISFSSSRNYIIARTIIGDEGSRVVSELRALSNTLGTGSVVEINYTVFMPQYMNLVLSNKYGDIYIDDINGDVDISLSNGVLKANSLTGNNSVELIFSKGAIRNLGNTSLTLSYADLELSHVSQLDLVGKSSELRIDTVGVMKIDSRRDGISLGEVEYLYGVSSFSDIKISTFIREADCNLKYGSFRIDNVRQEFSRINLDSDFTDILLYFKDNSAYLVDILYNEKAIVNLPGGNSGLETRKTGEEFYSVEGYVGNNKTDKRLSIKADHKCYITISNR